MMRSESTRAFGQPRDTKLTVGLGPRAPSGASLSGGETPASAWVRGSRPTDMAFDRCDPDGLEIDRAPFCPGLDAAITRQGLGEFGRCDKRRTSGLPKGSTAPPAV